MAALIYYEFTAGPMKTKPEELTISVVGLGYVGLPTALALHKAGFEVYGVDISEDVIETLKGGGSPFVDESSELIIPVDSESWNVTCDFGEAIPKSDIVLITVPTPVTESNEPDLSFVISASRSILQSVNTNSRTIVTLESTVYPGVTRKELGAICEELGLTQNEEVFLAYSPERVSPGESNRTVDSVARIVGCDSREVGELLSGIYSLITKAGSTYVGSIEVAEASKLIENVQRDIDLAFVNELSTILPQIGIDVEEVLDAASTKWNFHRHTPGIGVGGHCIPVDPYFYISLSQGVGSETKLGLAARKMNESMPEKSFQMISQFLEREGITAKKALVLGFSYKSETGDSRETPVRELTDLLVSSGIETFVWDPYVDPLEFPDWVTSVESPVAETGFDLVVLATAHEACVSIDWENLHSLCNNHALFDGRRALMPSKMKDIGWIYHGVGYPLGANP